MQTFKAFRIHQDEGRIVSRFGDQPRRPRCGRRRDRVAYSDINFKDALAATGVADPAPLPAGRRDRSGR
jgi:hypothetical protein